MENLYLNFSTQQGMTKCHENYKNPTTTEWELWAKMWEWRHGWNASWPIDTEWISVCLKPSLSKSITACVHKGLKEGMWAHRMVTVHGCQTSQGGFEGTALASPGEVPLTEGQWGLARAWITSPKMVHPLCLWSLAHDKLPLWYVKGCIYWKAKEFWSVEISIPTFKLILWTCVKK